ncbi:MAG: magnesium transporter [Cystobacterineae bacterium]|nr:magnesium transporter [Cystobacterineae bacterium]
MLGKLVGPDLEQMLANKEFGLVRETLEDLHPADIAEVLEEMPRESSALIFRIMPRNQATEVFEYLPVEEQSHIVRTFGTKALAAMLNEMAPDDRMRLFEELPAGVTRQALATLSPSELEVARELMGYPEESAGRYMTPEYLTLGPDMTAEEALAHIRIHGAGRETLNMLYVVDERGKLLDDVRLSSLVMASPQTKVVDLVQHDVVTLSAKADREEVVGMFEKYDRVALPVIDSEGVLVGIITVDDVLDVAKQEATEDIHGLGGVEALDAPYFDIGIFSLFKKRGGWLALLFLGEMLTATAMAFFEDKLAKAVVLSLFIPLIISSGGNSGSQATSIIIRSLALREIELRNFLKVFSREVLSGLMLGTLLGSIGFVRIVMWERLFGTYGEHSLVLATVVFLSLVFVVLFGNLVGASLPFFFRSIGFDPAKASAPFVATIVDVSGLIIYFSVAGWLLTGTLL